MKFAVTRNVDYVMGYLKYGHFEGVVEVESEAELRKLIDNGKIRDYLDLVVDEYEVEDIDHGDHPVEYEAID